MTEEQLAGTLLGMVVGFGLFLLVVALFYMLMGFVMLLGDIITTVIEHYLKKRKAKRKAIQQISGGKAWMEKSDYILSIKRLIK